ncbi:MAG: MFS transporter [Labilithrix sp.]|nr:MFS transporter [Labilithrix sp.]MCW5812788.1 MFS transporter [Labilithrix sp.]
MSRRIPDKNIWVIYAAILLLGIAYGLSIAVLAIHLDRHHIPKMAMGGLAAAFAFGIISFSIPAGWVVRRWGTKRTLLGALAGYAVCVASFPFLGSTELLSGARFFDGAFSAGIWVAAETALLQRSSSSNKAFVMSLYAISIAIGYVVGPLLARLLVAFADTPGAFIGAGFLTVSAALVVLFRFESMKDAVPAARAADDDEPASTDARLSALGVVWRTKTSCLGTFTYGYFQSSVVLFLPLFLIEDKHVQAEKTILITAFFALGMLTTTTIAARLGDRHGHLLVMRVLGAIGGTMVASFVLLSSFEVMCVAVFIAGGTLAAISPVSLALQGVIMPRHELERANAFYNAAYAAGMLIGPPISGAIFTRMGGAPMLVHLAGLWAVFVAFTAVFANDDPHRARRRFVASANPG